MSNVAAPVVECFSSIQGEGVLVGLRQVFLRLSGCNMACSFCDTAGVTEAPAECLLELTPGRRDFETLANPVAIERIVALIERWERGWPKIHHSISITGGEPLLHAETLSSWLPQLRRLLPIHLETNGTLPDPLSTLLEHVDYVGMDIKLPSATGCPAQWEEHEAFLALAHRRKVYVKAVVSESTTVSELDRCSSLIAAVDEAIPLILQPVTRTDGGVTVSPLRMLELQEVASGRLTEVRVIPQTHKFMGQL